jgi:hypothetical protein
VDCRAAREAISERMDGERLASRRAAHLDEHLGGCEACRSFVAAAWRIREDARFEVVGQVPDLVGPIMTAVRTEAGPRPATAPPREVPAAPPHRRRGGGLRRELTRLVAALVAGTVAGAVVVAVGLWPGEEPGGTAASEGPSDVSAGGRGAEGLAPLVLPATASPEQVSLAVLADATALHGYHARYLVEEWNFRPSVPLRSFTIDVWFDAPERFRLEVKDHTPYPAGGWPGNDLTIVADGERWYSSSPANCPLQAFPTCPLAPEEVRKVVDRPPFAASSPILTDALLPVGTLGNPTRLSVLGPGRAAGRDAIRVALAYRDAAPLFAVLRQGGTWRPFFSTDQVLLWLDAETSVPLRYEVHPAPGPARAAWAASRGLGPEDPDRPVFTATATLLEAGEPSAPRFAVPAGPGQSGGAISMSFAQAAAATGHDPILPGDTAGLDLYRVVRQQGGAGGPHDQTVVSFSEGLAWLKVRETREWRGGALFGGLSIAERVELPDGGVAYLEPTSDGTGRRLALHGDGVDLVLESNLSRERLLDVAASLPVRGLEVPMAWLVRASKEGTSEQVPIDRALAEVGFPVLIPADLPAGYRVIGAEILRVADTLGLNAYFRAADGGGTTIRLHAERAANLPPASGAEQYTMTVRDSRGRWSPARATLEWIEAGTYHSLTASGLRLEDLMALAATMTPGGTSP